MSLIERQETAKQLRDRLMGPAPSPEKLLPFPVRLKTAPPVPVSTTDQASAAKDVPVKCGNNGDKSPEQRLADIQRLLMATQEQLSALHDECTVVEDEIIRPKVSKIIKVVADHYRMASIELLSSRRAAYIVRPRHVVMYLAKTHTKLSYPQIGRHMGGRDHTTVMHGYEKVRRKLPNSVHLQADIAEIEHKLGLCVKAVAHV